MLIDGDNISNIVNLDSYSSSIGFIGFFERSGKFNEPLCHKATELFFKAFNILNEKEIYILTSLFVEKNLTLLTKKYGVSNKLINSYLKPLIKENFIKEFDYTDKFESLEKKFVMIKEKTLDLIKKVFFSVMFIGGIHGHCFAVFEKKDLIIYPHDDTGFGFISIGGIDKKKNDYIKKSFETIDHSLFNLCLE